MCIKKDGFSVKKSVFAHAFLLPKSICEYGSRVFSLVAVSDVGKEFRRDAALRELEQKYKTDEPVFGAMYMTPFGTLIDCSMFPNGHADVSAWLHEQGLEIDYQPGEPSQLLHLKGWLRLNTKVGYVEQSDRAITVRQQRRIAEIFGEEKKDG